MKSNKQTWFSVFNFLFWKMKNWKIKKRKRKLEKENKKYFPKLNRPKLQCEIVREKGEWYCFQVLFGFDKKIWAKNSEGVCTL